MTQDRREQKWNVYILAADEIVRCKVGMSTMPERRITEVQTRVPVHLRLHKTFPDLPYYIARAVEFDVLKKLDSIRVIGEWLAIDAGALEDVVVQSINEPRDWVAWYGHEVYRLLDTDHWYKAALQLGFTHEQAVEFYENNIGRKNPMSGWRRPPSRLKGRANPRRWRITELE